jgi:hypothetical protein
MVTVPDFANKVKLYDWLVSNKSLLIAQKKSTIKHADAFSSKLAFILDDDKTVVTKADAIPVTATKIKVRSIINTTKLFDSHGDVHIDQLWNKSLKENKENYLVKEHAFSFNGIISDNVHAFTKQMTWHELNFNYEGSTQALVYDSIIDQKDFGLQETESYKMRTEMQDMYRRGKVKQHSVGMRYVSLTLAINNDRYEEEFTNWEKYFEVIANKEDVLDAGYFYPVTQAKNIEGSAVVKGSNFATPTYSVEAKDEPLKNTPKEQVKTILTASEMLKYYQPKI